MIYLLIAALVVDALAIYFSRHVGTGDDYAGAFYSIVFSILGSILTVVYVMLVFWNHRFI